jgi:3'-phosphoadenosine 5'-phosphosulfate sulfotransferase (PAPS reductase)/FAD synthetase
MFPDMKNRWCTSYLKTGITDKWIRANRHILGEKCLFITGERRDESPRRSRLPEIEYHRTTLKTERVAKFEIHWYRPCLDYEKGQMFEQAKEIRLQAHPCYEYVDRCSCMFCVFMKDKHTIENMKRHPEMAKKYVQAEIKLQHTWKAKQSLENLWNTTCEEIEDGIVG